MSDWSPLVLATCNAGDMSVRDAQKVARSADAVCFQEMGDRRDIKSGLKGYRILDGNGKPGQASTPLGYDPNVLELVREFNVLLRRASWWGRGTGPDTGKAKWLIGGLFHHLLTRRRVLIASTHLPPTQGVALRRKAAQEMSAGIVKAFAPETAVGFVGMDANCTAGKPGVQPLVDAHWTWSQAQDPTPTHGKRGIDGVWWRERDKRMRYDHTETIATGSDHLAAVVTFQLLKRAPR